jgi:hypothetical protein
MLRSALQLADDQSVQEDPAQRTTDQAGTEDPEQRTTEGGSSDSEDRWYETWELKRRFVPPPIPERYKPHHEPAISLRGRTLQVCSA